MEYRTDYLFGTNVSRVYIKHIHSFVKDKKVLDLGCGTGDYLPLFGKGSLGLDIAQENLKFAKKLGRNVKYMDLNNPSSVGKFECVFSAHVLEHVESPINYLRFANKSLSKNGILILSVPNEASLIHYKHPYFTNNGNHLYSFSVNNIKELLLTSGFKISSMHFDYYTVLTKKYKLDFPIEYTSKVLPKSIKNKLSWAYWFISTKVF